MLAFKQIRPVLAKSDYVIGDLETPIVGNEFRYAFEEVRFNAPVAFLRSVKNLGVEFVSLVNNDCLDRGHRGADITLGKVLAMGLSCRGFFKVYEESDARCVVMIGVMGVGIVSCTCGTNQGRRSDLLPVELMWKVDQLLRGASNS